MEFVKAVDLLERMAPDLKSLGWEFPIVSLTPTLPEVHPTAFPRVGNNASRGNQ